MARKSKTTTKSDYEAKDIYVLQGLEPVRRRPGMYIGSTGPEGLHHLIWEVLDNAIDECMAGYANEISITLFPGNKVECRDNGRGIPVEKHPQTKKSALETVMTTLHAGAKFGGKAYTVAGGLHGVGVSVVCALSLAMKAEVCRGGFRYLQEYSKGKPKANVKKTGQCRSTGTTVSFEPDPEIFPEIKFNHKTILNHLRQQAYLTPNAHIEFFDFREKEKPFSYGFYFEGGLQSYLKNLVRQSKPLHQNIFFCQGSSNEIAVEAAFQYTQERECYEEAFANNINTPEGGTHLTGFRTVITRVLNDYARKNNFLKEKEENLTGEDTREGLNAIISVKLKEPQFEGQTKAKLGNPEVKSAVEGVIAEKLVDFLERNPQDGRVIIENCFLAAKARKAAKAARQTVLRRGILEGLSLPGKLADCSCRKPEDSELFIVEGDSAGGCFDGETKVALTDGRNLTFKELIKEDKKGKKNYCYTIEEDGRIGIGLIQNPRKTREEVEVIKIILDNNEEIICTPDHLFMLRNGFYKKAEYLAPRDSLMPLYRKYSEVIGRIKIEGYEMVYEPRTHKWLFTHLLADKYNLKNGIYLEQEGSNRHHIDFDKLNNNPDNIMRMPRKKHMAYHQEMVKYSLHTDSTKEKCRQVHQLKEYREKIRAIMLRPEMRKVLSERAKNQWKNEEYKKYMVKKFLEFYKKNSRYRKENNARLNNVQREYWSREENKERQAERVRRYFEEHPEVRETFSRIAKKQWQDEQLLQWRGEETRKQWTSDFRLRRINAYNQTYLNKALRLMREIFEKYGRVTKEKYNQERLRLNDKSIVRYETICQRFFESDEEKLKAAVLNYNHKIKKIIKLRKKIDVYDLEVNKTHNFALAAGVFVHNSGRQARDRRFQAILPLRGKILNVEKARLDKILDSKEIKSLIIALGTAISEDFNLEKLRYHRIILTLDADVDGSHIRTLLLTLFFRYFKPLIERGHLYIAQPPLYKLQAGKAVEYAYTEEDKAEILRELGKEKTAVSVQRYKGLGEMNPEELAVTTMDVKNRILLKVTIENAQEADKVFDILMGEEVLPRKKFIQAYAKKVKNLDI